MSTNGLRIGFIGSGWIARQHSQHLREIDGVSLGTCFDPDKRAMEFLARTTGCTPVSEYGKVIDDSDAVFVCSPPRVHREHMLDCLEAEKHVYCEKPLAVDLEDGRAIVAAGGRANCVSAVGFNFRFFGAWKKCLELVRAGEIGRPVMFAVQRLHPGPTATWRRDPGQLCGMTIESVSHDIDLMCLVHGEISQITAQTAATDPSQPEFDNCLVANVRMKSGAFGSLQVSWASTLEATRHALIGTEGSLFIEGPRVWDFSELHLRRHGEVEQTHQFRELRHRAACRHFVAAVREEEELQIPIVDGLRALEACHAMVASAKEDGALKEL